MFDNEQSLNFLERHPYISTVKYNRRTGASRLQDDVICVVSCLLTAIYVFINSNELC
jgi:hypothetical protein